MKKKKLYISVLITILLVSCAETTRIEVPGNTDLEYPAIQFSPVVSSTTVGRTRALTGIDDTGNFPTGDHNIGLYMMKEGGSDIYTFYWEDVVTSASQYSNVRATLNSNRSATPVHKWTRFAQYNGANLTPENRMTFGHASASGGLSADFYAYYPHVAIQQVPVTAIPFTLSTTSDITDILYAYHKDYSYTNVVNGDPVKLDFRHALSMISFNIINGGNEDVLVSGGGVVDVENATNNFIYTACSMNLFSAIVGIDGGKDSSCEVTPNTPGIRSTILASNVTVQKDNDSGDDIVNITLPYVKHSGLALPKIRAYLTISYATSSTGGFATSYGEIEVPEIGTGEYGFKQGYKYSYDITVTSTGISFSDVKIAEWEDASTESSVII